MGRRWHHPKLDAIFWNVFKTSEKVFVCITALLYNSIVYEVYHRCPEVLELVYVQSLLGNTARHYINQIPDLFQYYSLGGDTARPGKLHAMLCHAFLVVIN